MTESGSLLIKVNPTDILYIIKLLESIDNIGVVTVIDGKKGILEIKSPFSNREELMDILNNLNKEFKVFSEKEEK